LPRFQHGGMIGPDLGHIGHDEVPIIAHRGEMVVPAHQAGQAGARTVHQYFNITTQDANSFRAAQSHIMADAHKSALAAARKS
jgi:hypothetical protein